MRVLISGGTGYIGGRLAVHLSRTGHQIVLGSRKISGSPEWLPDAEMVQEDGRIRRWAKVEEMGDRYLRVILLADGITVHNAFFDRRYKP